MNFFSTLLYRSIDTIIVITAEINAVVSNAYVVIISLVEMAENILTTENITV
ncbi:hypothetical protein [Escherichia phage AV101]|nr:hypothetical protein [Escherichia phage AV101]